MLRWRVMFPAPDGAGGASPGGNAGAGAAAADDGAGGDDELPPERAALPRHGSEGYKAAFDKLRADLAAGTPRGGAPVRPGAPTARPAAAAAGGGEGAGDEEAATGDGEGAGDEAPVDALTVLEALELEQEEHDRIVALPEDERDAEIARIAAERDELIVDLGARREGEETLRIMAPDKQTADLMRARLNQAASAARVERMREGAEAVLAEAEELRYTALADPAGFLEQHLQDPADRGHTVMFLLSRPGVLDAKIGETTVGEWIRGILDDPTTLASERRLVEADRVNREKVMREDIEVMRYEDRNARACRRAMVSAIESLSPDDWDDQRKEGLFQDAWRDLRATMRANRLRTYDAKRMTGIVQHRLSIYGVAPRSASGKPAAGQGPGGQKPPASQRSPADLKRQQDARRRAAGAGPGAGSPAAAIPKPPKGTMLTRRKGADGKTQGSVFDWLRERMPSMRRVP